MKPDATALVLRSPLFEKGGIKGGFFSTAPVALLFAVTAAQTLPPPSVVGSTSKRMYHFLCQTLFHLYWVIAVVTGALLVREAVRDADWKTQATAALAVIPFLLRAFLLK